MFSLFLVSGEYDTFSFREMLTQKHTEINDWINLHRKLRDRLVEAERFQLAVEISSKCNLEKNVVLAAWGLSLLKVSSMDLSSSFICFEDAERHAKFSSVSTGRGLGRSKGETRLLSQEATRPE